MTLPGAHTEPVAAKRILGIDPGTNRAGYGVLEADGKRLVCLALGDIDLHRFADPYLKLGHLFERVSELIEAYQPTEAALEAPFFGENVQSMLKLGRAQGVAMAAALHRGIPVHEYAPTRIKQAITGRGNASKEQVAAMLKSMFGIDIPPHLDATDGLAVALCHHFLSSSPLGAPKHGGHGRCASWENFIEKNPDRIIKPK